MAEFEELVEVLKHLLLNKFAPKPDFIRGILGDGLGNVLITDRPDYNLVRFNRSSTETFEIFNKEVTAVDGWPVLIGEFPWQPGLTQVVGTDLAAYEQSGWGTAVSGPNAHAPTHEWPDGSPGSDPLSIYMRAVVPLRAYSAGSGSSTVFVNSYEFDYQETGTIWPGVPGVDLSPVMSATATGSARFVGVFLDPGANTLGVVTGTTTVHTPAVDPPLIAFPAGMIPSARIKVFGGQADIGDADIRDARRPFVPGITGSAGGGAPTGPAGGDLTGSYPNPTVKGLQTQPVSSASPAEGEVLMFTGSIWQPHTIPATVPTGLAGGDLSGSYPDPQVVGLFDSPISNSAPSPGDLLYFTGSIWQPSPLPTQAIPFGLAGGDLTGSFPNPQVAGLFGSSLLGDVPTAGDVLTFTGSAWRPQAPAIVTPGPGEIRIGTALYATIAAATTAANSGDLIWLGVGTYSSGGLLLPSGVHIAGMGTELTTITDGIGINNASISNITVDRTGSSGSDITALLILNTVLISNIKITGSNAGAGNTDGLATSGTVSAFSNGGLDVNVDGRAIDALNGATLIILNSRLDGSNEDLRALGGATVTLHHTILVNETTSGAGTIRGFYKTSTGNLVSIGNAVGNANVWAFRVKNTSGAAANANDVGFIDSAGEYQTTTTAQDDVAWCVVATGGDNNADIYVARRGRVTVAYAGGAPSTGDFLVTSTTAGSAQAQATMRPEIFAVCLANGAGGTVEALLLTGTRYVNATNSLEVLSIVNSDDSDWRTTINGAPAGAVVTYTAPLTSGAENTIVPRLGTELGKLRLYNETRSNYALIDSVNIGANTITLTANAPGDWVNTDVITTRSQTADTGASPFLYDVDLSSDENTVIPLLARALQMNVICADSGATGGVITLHPWETYSVPKRKTIACFVVGEFTSLIVPTSLIQRRYCVLTTASGAGTADTFHRLAGWWEATP